MRELEHTIERAVVLSEGPTIGASDLAIGARRGGSGVLAIPAVDAADIPAVAVGVGSDGVSLPLDLSLEEAERRYAKAILERVGGNQTAAAKALGISRNKLARLLRG